MNAVNSIFANIYARRAVREYKPDNVPDQIIKEMIKAGIYAPSALNEQPWRFVVIKNRGLIKRCSDRAKKLWLKSVTSPVTDEAIDARAAHLTAGEHLGIIVFCECNDYSQFNGCVNGADN